MKISDQGFLKKIERHKGILLKVSRMYCSHPEDREDLIQEMVLQMWQAVKNFKEKSQFSTWMYRVAINTALVHQNKHKKRIDKMALDDRDIPAQAAYSGKHERQLETFYQAIEYLSPVEKALMLLYIEGQSGAEIAKTLGISATNVRVRTNRTKTKLQQIIEAHNHEH